MRRAGPTYIFGHFRLDLSQHLLLCEGKRVPLTVKAFDVLRVLIENAGYLVEKDELLNLCWPNAFVAEANIPETVWMIRRALGDLTQAPEYIETVHRRGYRFIAAVGVKEQGH